MSIIVVIALVVSYNIWGMNLRFEMIDVVNEVTHALRQYRNNQPDGSDMYPAELELLIGTEWLETMPVSPYTRRAMRVLEEGESPRRGTIRYEVFRLPTGMISGCKMTCYGASINDKYEKWL